jgi:hypothetical protein
MSQMQLNIMGDSPNDLVKEFRDGRHSQLSKEQLCFAG